MNTGMKNKPKILKDLSELGSVISFKAVDEKAYDGDILNQNRYIDEISQWNPISDKVKKRAMDDLFLYGIAITKITSDGIENINYEDVPKVITDKLDEN